MVWCVVVLLKYSFTEMLKRTEARAPKSRWTRLLRRTLLFLTHMRHFCCVQQQSVWKQQDDLPPLLLTARMGVCVRERERERGDLCITISIGVHAVGVRGRRTGAAAGHVIVVGEGVACFR